MPWWLLGMSMVATTFSTDTPNLVTNLVREGGVSANWVWWAFLLTGMLTVFVYARLWRKSGVTTDLEFYDLRYAGKTASFLRSFRAIYLGIIFNVLAMAGVTLAAIKIGQVMLGLSALETVGIAGLVTVIFSALGGFKGVVYTDFILFFTAMAGAIGAAYYLVNLPEIGGLEALINHPNLEGKLSMLPDFNNTEALITILIIPLSVQWWSSWYPGAEPGGGGYVAQRMLAAKDENHAIGATFLFNILHYALRPWPWIIVALVSLVLFPDLASIKEAFPNVTADKLGEDLGYSAMLTMLPQGLLGLVMASLIAAYMSTISTHLNWGASYIVNDFYKMTINKNASEKQLVNIGRFATVFLMVVSAVIALLFQDAFGLFSFILAFGAGTGLIFILRWFWWRINAWSEISAMVVSGIVSILFSIDQVAEVLFEELLPSWSKFPLIVLITTIAWLLVTFLTKPEPKEKLVEFYKKTRPGGRGWNYISKDLESEDMIKNDWKVPQGILAMICSLILVYGLLFGTGYMIYQQTMNGLIAYTFAAMGGVGIYKIWPNIRSLLNEID
jgi:Na+/proline symporter